MRPFRAWGGPLERHNAKLKRAGNPHFWRQLVRPQLLPNARPVELRLRESCSGLREPHSAATCDRLDTLQRTGFAHTPHCKHSFVYLSNLIQCLLCSYACFFTKITPLQTRHLAKVHREEGAKDPLDARGGLAGDRRSAVKRLGPLHAPQTRCTIHLIILKLSFLNGVFLKSHAPSHSPTQPQSNRPAASVSA
jgi:hypothetical protein